MRMPDSSNVAAVSDPNPPPPAPASTETSAATGTSGTSPQSGFAPKRKPSFSERFARWVLIFFVLFIVLGAGYTWGSLHYTYSEGERVGLMRKLSHRGWLCKTWEGEISMANALGSQEQIFEYTVPNDAVVKKIRALEGKRVVILYKERKGIPSSCFGDTPYHAYDVREVK
jgi:hypothetical protein